MTPSYPGVCATIDLAALLPWRWAAERERRKLAA
jgi:hypothetical protein